MVSDKVALVIGNQQYQCKKLQGLFYPEKDAFDVAHSLHTLGFKVRVRIVGTLCILCIELVLIFVPEFLGFQAYFSRFYVTNKDS